MTEVISKTSLFLGACGNHHRVDDFSFSPVSFGGFGLKKSFSCLKLKSQKPLRSVFYGKQIVFGDSQDESFRRSSAITAQTTLRIGTAQKWWEKGLKDNMREISSAQELVDSLTNAGDKLVVVDFFSPGCGGCKALHPKVSIHFLDCLVQY
jgi:thiol-disulfide isomerase/thioredoxin